MRDWLTPVPESTAASVRRVLPPSVQDEIELEGAATHLEISRDDIDSTVHTGAGGMPSLPLFGTTPGGAGNVIRIGEHLEPVVEAAPARVGGRECGPGSSCHACLRTFRNERFHELLSRGEAVVLLDALAGRSTS
ncbi:DUF1998 domain-containing protein [Streptomyces sp.]|uniref:DUF1998 domain-containing protein n=1 Tax=Streptomyces sp. TaxID=1931 RepID=UPI0028110C55|nr:DUF1998 domain-containing protein [Streptomyces sp.]